jgi:hypothetical protein
MLAKPVTGEAGKVMTQQKTPIKTPIENRLNHALF